MNISSIEDVILEGMNGSDNLRHEFTFQAFSSPEIIRQEVRSILPMLKGGS
jgi:hypothetical protein